MAAETNVKILFQELYLEKAYKIVSVRCATTCMTEEIKSKHERCFLCNYALEAEAADSDSVGSIMYCTVIITGEKHGSLFTPSDKSEDACIGRICSNAEHRWAGLIHFCTPFHVPKVVYSP